MLSAGRVVQDVFDPTVPQIHEPRHEDDMAATTEKGDADLNGAIFSEFVENRLLKQTPLGLLANDGRSENARPI